MKKQSAFTLIELSIVLVIIGLIVGGVLVGQDLIKAANQRNMISKLEAAATAYHTFRLKYNCLPGDCRNAAAFGLGTNGNGDRQISLADGETDEAIIHLVNADLLQADITNPLTVGAGYVEGVCDQLFISHTDNGPDAGGNPSIRCHATSNLQMTPIDSCLGLFNIDTKIDDGGSNTGLFTIDLITFFGILTQACILGGGASEYNLDPGDINVQHGILYDIR